MGWFCSFQIANYVYQLINCKFRKVSRVFGKCPLQRARAVKKSFLLVANICIIFSKYIKNFPNSFQIYKEFSSTFCSSEEMRTRSALQLQRIYVSYAENFNTILMSLWILQTFHFNNEAFQFHINNSFNKYNLNND